MVNETFENPDTIYLWIAYTAVWLGLLAYIFYLHRMQRALEDEVGRLEKAITKLEARGTSARAERTKCDKKLNENFGRAQ